MRLGRQENVSETTTMLWWRLFVVSAVRLHSCTLDPSASSMQSSSSSFCLQRYPRSCVSWDTRKGQNSSTFFMDGCADIKTCSVLLRADPLQMNWLKDGCVTNEKGPRHTECLCNHLTYFSVMVVSRAAVVCTIVRSCVSVRGLMFLLIPPPQQMEPRPMRHLLALTAITSVGCAVSFISCVVLIVLLCRKK